MPNILWIHPLKREKLLLFSVSHHCKLNIFGSGACGGRNQKKPIWWCYLGLGNYNCHFHSFCWLNNRFPKICQWWKEVLTWLMSFHMSFSQHPARPRQLRSTSLVCATTAWPIRTAPMSRAATTDWETPACRLTRRLAPWADRAPSGTALRKVRGDERKMDEYSLTLCESWPWSSNVWCNL